MAQLLARARLIFAAVIVGCFVAFAAPALAQQSNAPIDPQADVVNQQTLLREFPRIQGEINQLDPRARVLIQPAGRIWDYFHQVVLRWIGAIAINGTLAALAASTQSLRLCCSLNCRAAWSRAPRRRCELAVWQVPVPSENHIRM